MLKLITERIDSNVCMPQLIIFLKESGDSFVKKIIFQQICISGPHEFISPFLTHLYSTNLCESVCHYLDLSSTYFLLIQELRLIQLFKIPFFPRVSKNPYSSLPPWASPHPQYGFTFLNLLCPKRLFCSKMCENVTLVFSSHGIFC